MMYGGSSCTRMTGMLGPAESCNPKEVSMKTTDYAGLFSSAVLADLFPAERADAFFEALYGDAEDGAYDIRLVFVSHEKNRLTFAFELHQRPGKCLACNLTYGLPQVFARHPVIGIGRLANDIASMLGLGSDALEWSLGQTQEHSRSLHSVPLYFVLKG